MFESLTLCVVRICLQQTCDPAVHFAMLAWSYTYAPIGLTVHIVSPCMMWVLVVCFCSLGCSSIYTDSWCRVPWMLVQLFRYSWCHALPTHGLSSVGPSWLICLWVKVGLYTNSRVWIAVACHTPHTIWAPWKTLHIFLSVLSCCSGVVAP